MTLQQQCALFGIYNAHNAFFMSHTVTRGLVHCTAQLVGYINPGPELQLQVQAMEDYERCYLFERRGQDVLRFDFLSARTTNRGRGGCASFFATPLYEADGRSGPLRAAPGAA